MGLLGLDDRAHPKTPAARQRALPASRSACFTQVEIDCAVGSNSRASSSRVRPIWRWWRKSPTTLSIIRIVRRSRHDVARLHVGQALQDYEQSHNLHALQAATGSCQVRLEEQGGEDFAGNDPPLSSPSQNGRRNLGCGWWPIGSGRRSSDN